MIYGIDYLRGKLGQKSNRVILRYNYYDMKNKAKKIRALIPPEFQTVTFALNWCATAVDSLADRLNFYGFDDDTLNLGEIYKLNNADVLHDSAVLSALISSCSFLYIDQNEDGYPRIEVVDGANATGVIDATTNMLTEGYAVIERSEQGDIELEAYFLPHRTEYYRKGKLEEVYEHDAPYPLLVPVINRPDARRPFGHSRISRSCMTTVQSAMRTMLRTEVAAEFYSVPQKYIVGLSQEAEFNNKSATLSSFLSFTKDEEGELPKLGQFQQQSMTPHVEHLKMLASVFAGETGLTLDDLGFSTSNPASYDAIRASHEMLRMKARKAQKTFGTGFLNAGYLACCIRDEYTFKREVIAGIKPVWLPIFEPDASAIGGIGDAVYKVNEAVPGFIGKKTMRQLTGLEGDDEQG